MAVALLAISNTLLTRTWVPAGAKREQIRLWSRNKAAELHPGGNVSTHRKDISEKFGPRGLTKAAVIVEF